MGEDKSSSDGVNRLPSLLYLNQLNLFACNDWKGGGRGGQK